MGKPSFLLVVPVYNCEKQIARVLSQLGHLDQRFHVLILDNQSKDDTVQSAVEAAKQLKIGVEIQRNKQNINLGGSLKKAFCYAIDADFEFIIVLHGDDQANIYDLLNILDDMIDKSDLLIGARFHPKSKTTSYSPIRLLGNKALNSLFFIATGKYIHDLIAGLNLYRISAIKEKAFLAFPNDLTFDAHLLLYAIHEKKRVCFFPITWRTADQVSNARVWKQGITIISLLLRYLIQRNKIFKSTPVMEYTIQKEDIVYSSGPQPSTNFDSCYQ